MENEKREAVLKGFEPDKNSTRVNLYFETDLGAGTGDSTPFSCHPMGATSSGYSIDICFPDRFDSVASFWGISEEQAELITGLVKAIKPRVVFETGTHRGRSTRAICDGLKGKWELTTVDIEDYWGDKKPLTDDQAKNVIRVHGKSPDILSTLSVKNIDFALIDGAHDYETVLEELYFVKDHSSEYCLALVDNYNDASWPGVTKAVDEFVSVSESVGRVPILSHTGMALLSL